MVQRSIEEALLWHELQISEQQAQVWTRNGINQFLVSSNAMLRLIGVMRNSTAAVRGSVFYHAREAFTCSPNQMIAECRCIIWVLQSLRDLHLSQVTIASDYFAVVEAINKPSEGPRFSLFIEYIYVMRSGYDKCEVEMEKPGANYIVREISKSVIRDGRFQSYLSLGGPSWLHDRIY